MLDRIHERVGETPFFYGEVADFIDYPRRLVKLENHDLVARRHRAGDERRKAAMWAITGEGLRRLQMFHGNRSAYIGRKWSDEAQQIVNR